MQIFTKCFQRSVVLFLKIFSVKYGLSVCSPKARKLPRKSTLFQNLETLTSNFVLFMLIVLCLNSVILILRCMSCICREDNRKPQERFDFKIPSESSTNQQHSSVLFFLVQYIGRYPPRLSLSRPNIFKDRIYHIYSYKRPKFSLITLYRIAKICKDLCINPHFYYLVECSSHHGPKGIQADSYMLLFVHSEYFIEAFWRIAII